MWCDRAHSKILCSFLFVERGNVNLYLQMSSVTDYDAHRQELQHTGNTMWNSFQRSKWWSVHGKISVLLFFCLFTSIWLPQKKSPWNKSDGEPLFSLVFVLWMYATWKQEWSGTIWEVHWSDWLLHQNCVICSVHYLGVCGMVGGRREGSCGPSGTLNGKRITDWRQTDQSRV